MTVTAIGRGGKGGTGVARRAALLAVRAYQLLVSPLYPPCCRFLPTCSDYAAEAIARHGALRGSVLAARRLLRCHPFSRHGHDPVPRGDRPAPRGDRNPPGVRVRRPTKLK